MPRTLLDAGLDEQERKVLRDVERHGLHVVNVLPERDTPGWSFSVGLHHSHRHPEVVVFGLDREVAHPLLNDLAEEIRRGRAYEDRGEYDDLLADVRCTFRRVRPVWYEPFLGWANWFHGDADYPVLQLVWPDHEQNYPWDAGFRMDWLWAQPLLFHDDPVAARAVELLASMNRG